MSEGSDELKQEPLDPEVARVVDTLQREYPSHATMQEQKRLDNNIRTSVTIIGSKADTWDIWNKTGKKQTDQAKIDSLVHAGFRKIKDLYPSQEERDIVIQHIDELITTSSHRKDNGILEQLKESKKMFAPPQEKQ